MDAVREFLRNQEGDIGILLRDDVESLQPGYLPFCLDIQLPRNCVVVIDA